MNKNSKNLTSVIRPHRVSGFRIDGRVFCFASIVAVAVGTVLFAQKMDAAVHTVGLDITAGQKTLNAGDVFNVGIYDMVEASTKRGGIRARSGAVVDVSEVGGITAIIGSPTDLAESGYSNRGVWIDAGARVDLGNASIVKLHAEDNVQGIGIANEGSFAANGINITMVGNSTIALTSTTVGASSYLGAGSDLIAGQAAIAAYNGGEIVTQNASLKSTRQDRGTIYIDEGTVTLRNSTVEGAGMGIELANSVGGSSQLGTVNVVGGSVHAKAGAAISAVNSSNTAYNHVVNASEGALITSESGILYSDDGVMPTAASSLVRLVASGDGTTMEGRIISTAQSNKKLTLELSENATWSSVGYSEFDTLMLDDANIELLLTSKGDRISVQELEATGSSHVNVGFSDSFIGEILNDTPYSGVALEAVAGLLENITFSYGTSSQSYTWTVIDNGDGSYVIRDIIAVPEPAVYASIIGAALMAFTLLRRRRSVAMPTSVRSVSEL